MCFKPEERAEVVQRGCETSGLGQPVQVTLQLGLSQSSVFVLDAQILATK